MGIKTNNAVGVKGRSGRKTKAEEMKRFVEDIKEKITNEALIELARSKVWKQISEIGDTPLGAKDFALPVYMKSMTEKIDHTTKGESIVNNDKIKNLADVLRRNNRPGSFGSDGTTSDTMVCEV